jgi:hypothetical protein
MYFQFQKPWKLYLLHHQIHTSSGKTDFIKGSRENRTKNGRVINNGNYDVVFSEQDQFTMAPFLLKYLKKPHVYYCQQPLRNDAISEVIFPKRKITY